MKKHAFQKSWSVYTGILRKSWRTTWSHKTLWLVAAIAGLANTGAVFNHIANRFFTVQPADQITVESVGQVLEAIPWFTDWFKSVLTLDTPRIILTFAGVLLLAVACIILIIGAQQLTLIHAHKQVHARKPLTFKKLWDQVRHMHFWRVFSIDALVLITTNIVVLASAFPLTALLGQNAGLNTLIYFGLYLILLPIGFLINAYGMLTLIHVVQDDDGLGKAVQRTTALLKKHWLVIFESALLLYVINLVAMVVFYLAVSLIAVPIGLFLIAALSTGTLWIMAVISAIGILSAILFAVLFFGGLTMFNYSVWAHVSDRLERYGLFPALESAIRKIVKT